MQAAATADPDVVSKSRFAVLTNVKPPRVTQWIAERKIHGPALVGEGRSARIRASVACAQLKRTLDFSQRLGNGLGTKLEVAAPIEPGAPVPVSASPIAPMTGIDPVEEQIKQEKLEQLRRHNRQKARDEAVAVGRLTDAALAEQQNGRTAAQVIGVYEGGTPQIAGALAAAFNNISQRDVVHVLRAEFRKLRAAASTALQRSATDMPVTVTFELGEEPDDGTPNAAPV